MGLYAKGLINYVTKQTGTVVTKQTGTVVTKQLGTVVTKQMYNLAVKSNNKTVIKKLNCHISNTLILSLFENVKYFVINNTYGKYLL